MVRHWAHFITTGRPLLPWPEWGGDGHEKTKEGYLLLAKGGDWPGAHWHTGRCERLQRLRFVWDPPSGWPTTLLR